MLTEITEHTMNAPCSMKVTTQILDKQFMLLQKFTEQGATACSRSLLDSVLTATNQNRAEGFRGQNCYLETDGKKRTHNRETGKERTAT
jgi:hypothetical protein